MANDENTTKTYHDKILIAKTEKLDSTKLKEKMNELSNNYTHLSNNEIVLQMKELIPEYISNNSEFERLDNPS